MTDDIRPPPQDSGANADIAARTDVPALFVFACLFLVVGAQFFTRYVLNDSLGWTEEIARYLLILLGFFGGAICARKHLHICLEFMHRYLPTAAIAPTQAFGHALTSLFFFYCGWLAVELAQRTASNMASVAFPKAPLYYIVAAACALTGVFAAAHVRRLLFGRGG